MDKQSTPGKTARLSRTGISVASSLLYCLCSTLMIFSNKLIYSQYLFHHPLTMLFIQNMIAVMLLVVLKTVGLIQYEAFTLSFCKKWLPVTIVFFFMLLSGFMSIGLLTVPMVTIFKNVTNISTSFGDYYFFNNQSSIGIKVTLALMLLSAIISGVSDLSYDLYGYIWMFANCVFTSGYTLTLRYVMHGSRMSDFGMAMYNNIISTPFLVVCIYASGEYDVIMNKRDEIMNQGWLIFWLTLSGVIGVLLNISSFLCIRYTSPTTYSIIGSLNKVPMTIWSILYFSVPVSLANFCGIALGLISGVAFSVTKYRENKQKSA